MAEIKDFPEKPINGDKSFMEVCDMLAKDALLKDRTIIVDFARNEYIATIIVRKNIFETYTEKGE